MTDVMFERRIVVYTKPACVQGAATYRALDKQGLPYSVIDITESEDARDYVMSLGYLQAPVVIVRWYMNGHLINEHQHWSGFRPDRIKALVADADCVAEFIARLHAQVASVPEPAA